MIINLAAAVVVGVLYIPYKIVEPIGKSIKAYLIEDPDNINYKKK